MARTRWWWAMAPLIALGSPGQAQQVLQDQPVIWKPVDAVQPSPAPDGIGAGVGIGSVEASTTNEPIVWTVVPESDPSSGATSERSRDIVVWETLPTASDEAPSTAVVWDVIPNSVPPLAPVPSTAVAATDADLESPEAELPQSDALAFEATQPKRTIPAPPPPPPLQALNRSIAFGDGLVGPDIGWYVPNGFRWSQRWFADASIQGQSRRRNDGPFIAWNNGDAVATFHANVLQTESWSVGLNTSFRSVYQGDEAAGGTTQVGEGIASGFRIAKAIGETAGIAFGGEQVIQWDDKTDTGRNLYLMASKGWWLGNNGLDYPLLIANSGFGTGRFANQDIGSWNNPLRFACVENIETRTGSFRVDNDLCWSPIGTISLVMNEWLGMFLEYRSGTAQAAASINLTGGIPLRLTWGVNFAKTNEIQNADDLTWVFRASFGF